MKILFSLLTLILITKECNDSKNNSLTEESQNASKIEQNDDMLITYTIQSRGLFEEVVIANNTIKTKNGRDASNESTEALDSKDWEALQKEISTVNLQKLPELKAPTDKRLYDGAAMATLKINKGGKEITTPTFDHGYPPKAIESLVNKVLSLKESASKD
ncbi:hypothetical protein [Winogradskyella sp. A3E31]|uniref:hypothetical protein n=1 Tax=Winogradskyella sp. A3E31 TaxID=3349637 RepID=UPI00398B986E